MRLSKGQQAEIRTLMEKPQRAYRGATSTDFTDPVSGTLARSSFAILSSKATRSFDNWPSSGDCFLETARLGPSGLPSRSQLGGRPMTLITCRVCQFWVRRKVPSPGGRVFALVKAVALDERALASAVEA